MIHQKGFSNCTNQQLKDVNERNRITGLLARQRCGPVSNGGLEHQSNSTSHARRIIFLNVEKELLEPALKVERAGLKWFSERFADHQKITIDKEDVSRELQEEKGWRQTAEVEDRVERVLVKAKEDDLNKRTRSEIFASKPWSSKKSKPDQTLEELG